MIVRIFEAKVASYTRTPTDCVHRSLVTDMDRSDRDDKATRSSEVGCTTYTRTSCVPKGSRVLPQVAVHTEARIAISTVDRQATSGTLV